MVIFERTRIIEDPQVAYDRVREELLESPALGFGATKDDINRYNILHDQLLEHRDGSKGHLHLEHHIEVVVFDRRLKIPRPPKKIPYWLKPGTNIVITK